MRTREQVSDEKLRGGFYSPDLLVDLCLERSRALLADRDGLRVLEPSAGDGAFLRGLERNGLADRIEHIEAVELLEQEASKASETLHSLRLPGRVLNENVLEWSEKHGPEFDLVLANPPYVRFQFISEEDKQKSKSISAGLGTAGRSVSNLWIPVLLLSLAKLRDGGVFSIILPTEFLTGISAGSVRNWLIANASDLSIDLFKPGSFPAVLQEVLVLSGRITRKNDQRVATINFQDHNGGTRSWSHTVAAMPGTWTNYLLTPEQNRAWTAVSDITEVQRLNSIARFTVSTVTGANNYFCVDSSTVDDFDLGQWSVPILPRSRYAKGLKFTTEEQLELATAGRPAWMLSFTADRPSPEESRLPLRYLQDGLDRNIDQRFKCRVRSPWYRVPVVPAGSLLLSKRSNLYPRVIANHAGVVTTDTIYRGQLLDGSPISPDDFTSTFHNSLTMLSAEIEGRSFGGGVLELVPSEISALQIPVVPGAGDELERLDKIARTSTDPEALIEATDQLLARRIPALDGSTMGVLRDAHQVLMSRRLQRTELKFYDEDSLDQVPPAG